MNKLTLLTLLIFGLCTGCSGLQNPFGSAMNAQYSSSGAYSCSPSDSTGGTYWCEMTNRPFGGIAPSPSPTPSTGGTGATQ